jgi:hypothetical protein
MVSLPGSPAGCVDADGDGFLSAECGGADCDDQDSGISPTANDVCGDGIDQDCSGSDRLCDGNPHGGLHWRGPETCLDCHAEEARQVHASVMYQWQGETPEMTRGPARQGKAAGGLNSYCISPLGNWSGCGSCHLGLGARPEPQASPEQLANIDCLVCHQEGYRRTRLGDRLVPDEAAMEMTMDVAAQTVHRPVRSTCLQCHAKAGGGDAVKRGDLTLAHATTTDRWFDVHMATTGGDLQCQDCHRVDDHRFAGRGSDLRPSDSSRIISCTDCHASMAAGGHGDEHIDRHTSRVACQTCHIPRYAKDAADTPASEATETHRTWLDSHSSAPPYHPASLKGNDLVPVYRFWNRLSTNALLYDRSVPDPQTGRHPTSRPVGSVDDAGSKLYPFKYKTAEQPIVERTGQLIALDTSVFFATADAAAAIEQGLVNMGLEPTEAYSWVETDTFQLLNHEVSPADEALECEACHGASARMDLQGDLGYALKAPRATLCVTCHDDEGDDDEGDEDDDKSEEDDRAGRWARLAGQTKDDDEGDGESSLVGVHDRHVREEGLGCESCHGFSRRGR